MFTITLVTLALLLYLAPEGRAHHFSHIIPRWWIPQALCVHSHEGSWRDPNPPHWGGMQMDWVFMHRYGLKYFRRWGTADHWPVPVQLLVAYRGWRVQGWGAWPNTSRMCGLR